MHDIISLPRQESGGRREWLMSALVLIVGPMASGKTSLCKFLFRAMREESLDPYAIIQENRRDSERFPVELRLIELPGGEQRFLGRRNVDTQGGNAAGNGRFDRRGFYRGREPFAFDDSAFAWASDKIRAALAQGCGILIMDEIGPQEIRAGRGLMPALETVAKSGNLPLVLSVRPALEEELLRRLPELRSRPILRIAPTPDLDELELVSLSRDIIRHCQNNK
jgi:nucleoside-triphosphatase THEP1